MDTSCENSAKPEYYSSGTKPDMILRLVLSRTPPVALCSVSYIRLIMKYTDLFDYGNGVHYVQETCYSGNLSILSSLSDLASYSQRPARLRAAMVLLR